MLPTAFWAALAVGLQLWAAGRAVPAQAVFTPYVPERGSSCRLQEYYNTKVQMCCSKCPPGYHVQSLCNKTSDTVCDSCERSTYTRLWNLVPACFSCNSRCSSGTATSNVACAPCAPGTFSDTTSSTDSCRPHRICSSVAIRGTSEMDAVCTSVLPTLKVTPGPALTRSQRMEPTPGSSTAPSTSVRLPKAPGPPSYPVEGRNTANISLPIGLIVGVTALGLLIIVLVNCVIMTQKKKKPFCLHGDAKVPHLPADKARSAPGPEQQHLLTTAPSSSSSSLESSASAADRRAPTRPQLQAPGVGKAPASCGSSEASSGGHGTQVNVTCIVNVCSGSDHSSRCPSQASSTRDTDTSPSGSPKDEQVPFSKEECPFQSQPGAPETLLQSPEEKPLPLGVPDAGMKPS
ncbi:PREDICTED: tumor necrosis factor receptor superfamily member 1B isoform X2 [Lipotes vexillifer]|uniref:Tumor necrosis factor receptor superfamily member 1B isoform X2 n=1 Tax=Lipotes vexillifer TaxID=118797 RepID=A0A340XPH7_LIPVE|nr:PREDICTED: tumor necrosis factor receptor superfamily member 1B isoform X2 [Lipotes vexillifer]